MINVTSLLRNLAFVEQDLSEKYGGFSLFGVCQRENNIWYAWDLIISAPWLAPNVKSSNALIFEALQRRLRENEMFALDAIPMFDPTDQRILEIQDEHEVEHGLIDLGSCQLFDMDMERVYIITAKRRPVPEGAEV